MSDLDLAPRALLQSASPILPARDMAVSLAFYRRLGFLVQPYADGSTYAFLSRDEQTLHLRLAPESEFTYSPSGVFFVVDDVDVLYDELLAAGLTPINSPEDKPWRMREFALNDPVETLLRFGTALHLH